MYEEEKKEVYREINALDAEKKRIDKEIEKLYAKLADLAVNELRSKKHLLKEGQQEVAVSLIGFSDEHKYITDKQYVYIMRLVEAADKAIGVTSHD